MIKPDMAVKVRRSVPFDRTAALLVGSLALLAAVLSFVQMAHSHASARATVDAARLATALATKISTSSQVTGFTLGSQQDALSLSVGGLARAIAAGGANLPEEAAIGQAQSDAAQQVQNEIDAMAATIGGAPLDPYAASLVTASVEDIQKDLAEQQSRADYASAEGARGRLAVLGISLAALAGIMVGLGVVLKESRPGWAVLGLGWVIACASLVAGVISVI